MTRKSQRSRNRTDASHYKQTLMTAAERALMMRELAIIRSVVNQVAMPTLMKIQFTPPHSFMNTYRALIVTATINADVTINRILSLSDGNPDVQGSGDWGTLVISYDPNVKYEIKTWSGTDSMIGTIWNSHRPLGTPYPQKDGVIYISLKLPADIWSGLGFGMGGGNGTGGTVILDA